MEGISEETEKGMIKRFVVVDRYLAQFHNCVRDVRNGSKEDENLSQRVG